MASSFQEQGKRSVLWFEKRLKFLMLTSQDFYLRMIVVTVPIVALCCESWKKRYAATKYSDVAARAGNGLDRNVNRQVGCS